MNRFKKWRNRDKWKRIKNRINVTQFPNLFSISSSTQKYSPTPISNFNYRNSKNHINRGTVLYGNDIINVSYSQKNGINKIDKCDIKKDQDVYYLALIDKNNYKHWLTNDELVTDYPIILMWQLIEIIKMIIIKRSKVEVPK